MKQVSAQVPLLLPIRPLIPPMGAPLSLTLLISITSQWSHLQIPLANDVGHWVSNTQIHKPGPFLPLCSSFSESLLFSSIPFDCHPSCDTPLHPHDQKVHATSLLPESVWLLCYHVMQIYLLGWSMLCAFFQPTGSSVLADMPSSPSAFCVQF